jgi:hypothetical protein
MRGFENAGHQASKTWLAKSFAERFKPASLDATTVISTPDKRLRRSRQRTIGHHS